MFIALVTETFPPEVNGVARTLWQLSVGLTDQGFRLDLIRPKQPSDRVDWDAPSAPDDAKPPWSTQLTGGIPIPFYRGLRVGLPAYHRLKARWREDRPNIVHIATEGPLGLSALQAAHSLDLPVCSSFHTNFHQYGSFYGYGSLTRGAIRYLRWFHNRTGRTLVPTEEVMGLLSAEGLQNLGILSRGVDAELFRPDRRNGELRQSWGAGPKDPVAIYVGRLAPEKDPDLALDAFERLREQVPECRCVVVGDGPSAPDMQRRDPQTVFCGMRRGVDLAEHYASADFLIFPSRTETFGNVLLEAMASGLPLVSFNYAAARLLVTHGEQGLVAPLDRTDQWLEQVVEMGRLPWDERRKMGVAAHAKAGGETWDRIVDRFVGHLNEVRELHDRTGAEMPGTEMPGTTRTAAETPGTVETETDTKIPGTTRTAAETPGTAETETDTEMPGTTRTAAETPGTAESDPGGVSATRAKVSEAA